MRERLQARHGTGSALLLAVLLAAGGAPGASAEESVLEFMERYEMALDHGDPRLLAEVYEDWGPGKESQLRAYFSEEIAELNVEFSELEVWQDGDGSATIRFLRRDRFTDARDGSRHEKRIRLRRELRRHGSRWKLAPPE